MSTDSHHNSRFIQDIWLSPAPAGVSRETSCARWGMNSCSVSLAEQKSLKSRPSVFVRRPVRPSGLSVCLSAFMGFRLVSSLGSPACFLRRPPSGALFQGVSGRLAGDPACGPQFPFNLKGDQGHPWARGATRTAWQLLVVCVVFFVRFVRRVRPSVRLSVCLSVFLVGPVPK